MKRLGFIFITVLMMSMAAVAQKGSFYVGGSVGYSSSTDKPTGGANTISTSWSFAPEAGTFLQDDIQLGLALGLSGSSIKTANTKVETTTNFSPTVYARKFFKVTDNFSVFAGAYLNFISGSSTDYTSTPSVKTTDSGVGIKLGAGVAYALSPRFTAVGQYGVLGFQSVTNKVAGTTTGTVSSFNFGVNTVGTGSVFNIGLYYTLKKAS
jgi:hypothetical protein